jgi:hypothetical protein
MEADIIFCILERLSFFDIVRYGLVNKQINYISKNELIWKRMSEEDYLDKIDDVYKKSYESHYRLYKFLSCYSERAIGKVLDLSCSNMNSIPSEISLMTNLRHLYLYGNNLRSIPPEIGLLTNLKELCLHRNSLESLPIEISKLTNLVRLDIDNNKIVSIPFELSVFTKLQELYVNRSQRKLVSSSLMSVALFV